MYISMEDVDDKFEAILAATAEERTCKLNEVCKALGMTTRDDVIRNDVKYAEDSGVYVGGGDE